MRAAAAHTCEQHNAQVADMRCLALRRDPTRTTAVRNEFLKALQRRFDALAAAMEKSIVEQDCFGIQPEVRVLKLLPIDELQPAGKKAFAFLRTDDKVKKFMEWLKAQEDAGILEVTIRPGTGAGLNGAWTDMYIQSSYAKGIQRSRLELKKAGYHPKGGARSVVTFDPQVGASIAAAMNSPFHADRLGVLFTRTFEDLKTVMNVTDTAIRRSMIDGLTTGLTKGMSEGLHPSVIARNLLKDTEHHLDAIGRTRANMIARTETARAHNTATFAEYRRADAQMMVTVEVEVLLGPNPCDECQRLKDGGPYTIEQLEAWLPLHPNCVCAPLPSLKERELQ